MIQSFPLAFYSFALLIWYLFIDGFNKTGVIKFYHTLYFYYTYFNFNILHFTSMALALLFVNSV